MMANKERQIKNSFIYLTPIIISNLIPLGVLPVLTRVLTKEDFGAFALAQIYAIFVTGLANFGLTIGYERNYFQYREPEKAGKLLYSTMSFVVSAFLICTILTYLLRNPIARLLIGSVDRANLLFWTFCSSCVMSFKTYYLTYFKNTENAKSFVWYTVDENVLGALLSLLMVAYLRVGVVGMAWGQLLASIIILSTLAYKFTKILPISFDWSLLKESLKLSYPLTPRIFFNVVGTQFDKYLVGLLASVGGVGVYSIGQKIANVVFTYMTSIQNVFAPQVYKKMFDLGKEGGKAVGKYLTPFAYTSILVALMVSLFSEEAINILTPKPYHEATNVVIIFSMLYGTYFFGKQPQLIFAKKTLITSILTMINIGLNVIINIPFIIKWGFMGAAWGTLTAGLISGSVYFIVSQRYYNIKWEYKKLLYIFLIFFVSSILIILMRSAAVSYSLRLAVKFISLVLYIYLGVKIELVTLSNLNLIKKLIGLGQTTSIESNKQSCKNTSVC